jgi:predicted nucleic acid-binding protein
MRVVLDPNVLVSGLIAPGGTSALILDAWRDGLFLLLTCEAQLDELLRSSSVCLR